MQLTLMLPGLLLPAEIRTDTLFDLQAPALSRLLGHATRTTCEGDWLAAAFGLSGPLPTAALRRHGAKNRIVDAGDTLTGAAICLDPVHLRVSREGISLADPADLRLDAEEADALIAALAPLFADLGQLAASAPGHWELALNRLPQLETRPLPDGIGTPVDPRLPGGEDGREWRRLLAEAQTVLHAHPVNQKREKQGLSTINSLWPWGPGLIPEIMKTGFTNALSNDPVLAGLCALAGLKHQPASSRFEPGQGQILAHDTRLFGPARALDAMTWRTTLLSLERDWFAPALAALKSGACQELRLVGNGFGSPDIEFTVSRRALWRFWRRPRPLTELA